MGNSSGVIIPKPLLNEIGLNAGDEVEMSLTDGIVTLAPVRRAPRAGWAADARAIAAAGEDRLVWPEFANEADDDLTW
ncbi:MAG: AbrB/MazE/SpoVT family DNA-binding domain-containing protein [Caulobacteraceae bacterium]